MGDAKAIRVQPISARDANRIIESLHYSGKIVQNSQLHLGVFIGDRCGGAMQFGPSLDKRKMLGLVAGTKWNEFIELNRMAFADWLPRNSESRALGYAMRWIRKTYPHLKWVISFADATQCGDGTIYRASGFILTGITESFNLARRKDGTVIHKMTLESAPTRPRPELNGRSYFSITGGKYDFKAYVRAVKGEILPGFQLRYIAFLDQEARKCLAVPVIPFERIKTIGASMYRGKRAGSAASGTSGIQPERDGATPIPALSSS